MKSPFASLFVVLTVLGRLEAADSPPHFVVPLHGTVGHGIAATAIEDAFKVGLRDDSTVLILDIDSPGGSIPECEQIIELLSQERERRTIAYVRNAYSAAAIIALVCDEIYMHQHATIGAATALKASEGGVTAAEEKFQSIWRSMCRRAAEIGGHDPLIAEAMVDASVQLRVVEKGGKKRIERALDLTDEDVAKRRVVSTDGKLLTATAREAASFGLAKGVVEDRDAVLEEARGLAGSRAVSDRGEQIMALFGRRVRVALEKMQKESEILEKELQLAVRSDPNRQQYTVSSGNRFTRAARAKWIRYSKQCYAHLKRCESSLSRIAAYARRFPHLQVEAEAVRESKAQIAKIRKAIEQGAGRRGI